MSEKSMDTKKDTGMCPHGNFPASCKICQVEQDREKSETDPFALLEERDPFDDFLAHIDQRGSRRPPTPEEREKMDDSLVALGRLFENMNVHWQLDGAINISLHRGEYIGIHKDVDISVELDELEDLEHGLEKQGYAFFLSYPKNPAEPDGRKIMKRVNAVEFREAAEEDQNTKHPMIAAVDEQGRIRASGPLTMIDTHIFRRINGIPVGGSDTPLPKAWYEPVNIAFHGTEIPLSHPAKVAYFKLHDKRAYDQTDLKLLAESGKISEKDIDDIASVIEAERKGRVERATKVIRPIFEQIRPTTQEEEIFSLFARDPFIATRMPDLEPIFRAGARLIAAKKDRSFDTLQDDFFALFGPQANMQEEKKRLDQLRQWVEEKQNSKKVFVK